MIGDPADPDLTAEWAEIHTRITFGLPGVRRIVAHGVRLEGRLVDGELSFGQLDRLLPEPTGEPFVLPELALTVSDAQIRLATPYGPVMMAVAGDGYLPDGFEGALVAGSNDFAVAGCEASRVRLTARVEIRDRAPHVTGPLRAASLACPEAALTVAAPRLDLDATISEAFDRWEGEAGLAAGEIAQAGRSADALAGTISFAGGGGSTQGHLALGLADIRLPVASARRATLDGYYRIEDGGGALGFGGDVRLVSASAAPGSLAPLRASLVSAKGTPFGPIGEALADALGRAASDVSAGFRLAAFARGGEGALRISALEGRSRSGARFALDDGAVTLRWPDGGLGIDGAFALAGGGFPRTRVELAQSAPGAPLSGVATIAPFTANGARLALAPVRFSAARDGRTLIETRLALSGPLADGRVEGLTLPVSGWLGRGGALVFGQGCVPLSWERLTVSTLTIGPTTLPLCLLEGGAMLRRAPGGGLTGGARIADPRLTATLGSTPLLVSAQSLRIPLADPGFVADNVSVRLGAPESQSLLDLTTLQGDFITGGVEGRLTGASGRIAAVPIRLTEGAGTWRFVDGVLDVAADASASHTGDPPLFEPLAANGLTLRLANGVITANAALAEPKRGTLVANVDLRHNLASGVGDARLDTPGIAFGPRLQPDVLTYLTTGVIAEVSGLLSGTGHIRWSPEGVTSDGVYRIADADLAAPFGPVTGLTTEIVFTDLLGLRSAPGQLATVAQANPGVIVQSGEIRYQILSSSAVRVEAGRWPFAGGSLILEPTVLEFGSDQVQRMTFRVERLDAFHFLEERQLENIAATGVFDGVLPVVVTQGGARIEQGVLRSRPPGGSLSYTGEISDVDLGLFGTLAFNALELIQYSTLTIGFDGAVDGEMVTNIDFTGVTPNISREGQSLLVAGLTGPLSALPIRFDITMRAPFQGLLYSVRLLDDPTFLVNDAIQRYRRERLTEAERNVQPPESDDLP